MMPTPFFCFEFDHLIRQMIAEKDTDVFKYLFGSISLKILEIDMFKLWTMNSMNAKLCFSFVDILDT